MAPSGPLTFLSGALALGLTHAGAGCLQKAFLYMMAALPLRPAIPPEVHLGSWAQGPYSWSSQCSWSFAVPQGALPRRGYKAPLSRSSQGSTVLSPTPLHRSSPSPPWRKISCLLGTPTSLSLQFCHSLGFPSWLWSGQEFSSSL